MNDVEYVHELSFVLMYSFDLYIEHGILVDGDIAVMIDPLC